MTSTKTTNPGITNILNLFKKLDVPNELDKIRNSGYGKIAAEKHPKLKNKAVGVKNTAESVAKSIPSQGWGSSSKSSSGKSIASLGSGSFDSSESSGDYGDSDSSESSGSTSPLLEGKQTFEELIGDICNGIDLIFATKRTTVVVTDYEGIYAEAKSLRDKGHKSVQGEDIGLWQIEDGSYELNITEYGFYNTVKIHYKNGVVTESYDDLVRMFGEKTIDYYEKSLDKTTASMKAKAYLAAHVRDFDMSIKANIFWDGHIDVGDIVTIENPLTMRDNIRKDVDKRDPEYYFVTGVSVSWEGDNHMTGTLDLSYGAKSPEHKEVPETGTSYKKSEENGDVEKALKEIGDQYSRVKYSSACQTADCTRQKFQADCFGLSDLLCCELKKRGITARIISYHSDHSRSGTHRTVQYKENSSGQWINFPYKKLGFSGDFGVNQYVNNNKRIKATCE